MKIAKLDKPEGAQAGTAAAVVAPAGPIPRHVAIIMDGNGRWATAHGLPRFEGHRRGVEAVRRTIAAAIEIGIAALTIFSFSSENWTRPEGEVDELMGLMKLFIRSDLRDLHARNVRVRILGEGHPRDGEIQAMLQEAEALTGGNTGLTLAVAFNYGSQNEIVRAARALALEVAAGRLAVEGITPDRLAAALDTAELPPLDLLIRTSGEQRLSNFLLWQAAYAELVFLPVLWPDFDRDWFEKALAEYGTRERRFGGLDAVGRL